MILQSNAVWKPETTARTLAVQEGSLWVTRTGDPLDRIVEAGGTLVLTGKGWVAQALGGTPCYFTTSRSLPTAVVR